MSDMKLPQGSDYHGNGKLFFKEDSYREKFPKGSNWKESDGSNHGVEIIGMDIKKYNQAITKIERLERELKDARECNNVKDKYWHNIGVERNVLQERVEELETELYFCNRNNKIKEVMSIH